jgi:O-6-methylguanine DNA methyltransferase
MEGTVLYGVRRQSFATNTREGDSRPEAAVDWNPNATRAVARACATNTVALVIPCHRVIRGTGELGGYRWGLARKRTLIDQERAGKAEGWGNPSQ